MTRTHLFAAAVLTALSAGSARADMAIEDAYARAATPNAKSGAAFMKIVNSGETEDRLIAVKSEIAVRVELHTHEMDSAGVMKMREVEEGFAIQAGETFALERGGPHVMFMGLTTSMVQGETVEVTFVFEKAGEVVQKIPVDLKR